MAAAALGSRRRSSLSGLSAWGTISAPIKLAREPSPPDEAQLPTVPGQMTDEDMQNSSSADLIAGSLMWKTGSLAKKKASTKAFSVDFSESAAISRFAEEDVQKHLRELQEMFKKEAEEERRRKQKELRRLAQKEKGVRTLVGQAAEQLDLHSAWKAKAYNLLNWIWFDFIIGIVISANAATIGVEAAMKAENQGDSSGHAWLVRLEIIFLSVYAAELGLRLYVYGLLAFTNWWVRFDAFLVLTGWVDVFVMAYADQTGFLDQVMMARLLRLTRLARIVRFFSQFRVLWALVQGMSHSVNTLVWTFFLIFSLLYTFAILGNDLIEEIDVDEADANSTRMASYNVAAGKFKGLAKSMLTLAQFLTFDTVGEIYRPLILVRPWLALYFVVFILLVSIALMNLVIAVMVENHMEQSRDDKSAERAREEKQKKKLLPKLRKLFTELDQDGSGDIDWDEIKNADPLTKQYLEEIGKGLDLEELFNMLDYDMCGTLDVDEFCEGLIQASTSDKPLELLRLVSMCAEILQTSRKALDLSQDLSQRLTEGVRKRRRYARNSEMIRKPSADSGKEASIDGSSFDEMSARNSRQDSTAASKGNGERPTVIRLAGEVEGVMQRLDKMDSRMNALERGIKCLLNHHGVDPACSDRDDDDDQPERSPVVSFREGDFSVLLSSPASDAAGAVSADVRGQEMVC